MDGNKTRYYETLGIEATASREEIADAYRQCALRSHPLRNPREREAQSYKQFTRVCEAYEVLSHPVMKRIYDKYGEYSVKNGVPRGVDKWAGYINKGDHFDVFERFFGTKNPFIEEPRRVESDQTELEKIDAENRADDIVVTLECTLYEFYNGAVKDVSYERRQMLSETTGSVMNKESLQVEVLPGFSEESRLVFKRRGHESFGAQPSDLVIKFTQKPMPNFKRSGDDLVYTHTLTLLEALQKQPVSVDTLDNRKVFVAPGDIVAPQTELRVAGEGMPCAQTGDIVADMTNQLQVAQDRPRGDLIVKFNIVFPKKVHYEHRQEIVAALKDNQGSGC